MGHLFALAVPIAVGMLVQTLYFLVDLYFVSRLGATALAGVGSAGNLMFLVIALGQVLSVGTVATVSHAVGAQDRPRASLMFHQAVLVAGVLAATTLAAGYLGPADAYVRSVAADAATVEAGTTYLRWFLPAMALQFATTAMAAALQGTGIVKPTMVVQMLTVLVNIVLTPVLVAGWGTGRPMGVAGAGLASTLAAATGVAMMAFYFASLEHYIGFERERLAPRPEALRRMLEIGLPAGGELGLMFVYIAVIYRVVSPFGASAQAGFGAGVRVMQAVFLPAMAIAFAVPALAGQNFGAREGGRVRETFRKAVLLIAGFMLALTLLCQWRPGWLVAPFASDPRALAVAAGFMTIVSWNFVASGLTFTCSGMFQGMGNTLPALAASATRLVTFVPPAFWLLHRPGYRIQHVWYLSVTSVTIQALVSLLLLRRQLRRRLRFDDGAPATGPA